MALGGGANSEVFRGRLECSCSRRMHSNDSSITENAFYVSEKIMGDSRVKISFINEIGWGENPFPVHGWNFTGCSYDGTCRTSQNKSEDLLKLSEHGAWDWNGILQDVVNGTIQAFLPAIDIAIYNRGLWGVLNADRAERIMPLLHNLVGDGQCFYRTSTAAPIKPQNLGDLEMQRMAGATFHAGCSMLDFWHLTDDFWWLGYPFPIPPKQEKGNLSNDREWCDVYWDAVHFIPWVYEELNNLLLNVLCNRLI